MAYCDVDYGSQRSDTTASESGMSTEETTDTEGQEAPAAQPSGIRLPIPVVMFVAGLAVGGAVGWFTAGPMLVKRAFPGGVPAAYAATPQGDDSDARSKLDSTDAPVNSHLLENLIVNPAGTQGTRFLLVSVAFETTDAATAQVLEQRDLEVRDAVINLFGSETIENLSEVSMREAVKDAVRERVEQLIGRNTIGRIYFPQFVIQ